MTGPDRTRTAASGRHIARREIEMNKKTTKWYEAELGLMSGSERGECDTCGHKHRTPEAAEKCLPKPPKNRPGSTQYFSMAEVKEFTE